MTITVTTKVIQIKYQNTEYIYEYQSNLVLPHKSFKNVTVIHKTIDKPLSFTEGAS